MGGSHSKTTTHPEAGEIIATGAYTASGAYTCKFTYYSSICDSKSGNYLVLSNIFKSNNEYSWAIYFYPNGKKIQRNGDLLSFAVQLQNNSNVEEDTALFKIVLVDQSGKGKHLSHTHFGLTSEGCQWTYLSEEYLRKSGCLKDDCIQVICWISSVVKFPERFDHLVKSSQLEEDLRRENACSLLVQTDSWLHLTNTTLFDGYYCTTDDYWEAVDNIQRVLNSGTMTSCQSEEIIVMDMVMRRLQLEFKAMLQCSIDKVENHMHTGGSSTSYESSGSNSTPESRDNSFVNNGELFSNQVSHLSAIVSRLKSCKGVLRNCIEVYNISRKSVVDATFLRFGIGRWTVMNVQSVHWNEVMIRMRLWSQAMDVCFRIIFPREKKYFEQIFGGIDSPTYDDCFLVIITYVANQLCYFAEIITNSPGSLEKLFGILDLYDSMLSFWPEIKATFDTSSSAASVYVGAANVVDRLAERIRQIISSFEDTVLNEQMNTPVSRGAIHQLTTYTIDYVTGMLGYKELLSEIIISAPEISREISDADGQFLQVQGLTPFVLHLVWILTILRLNLEVKATHYVDASTGHLFLIKNINHIIARTERCPELLSTIGMEYLIMLRQYVGKREIEYVESIRIKALYCLRDKGLRRKFNLFNGISKSLKNFNATIEELIQTRWTWLESDLQLKPQLKSILDELISAYESFLFKYKRHVESEKYVKYLPEDLKNKLQGKPKNMTNDLVITSAFVS